MIRAILNYILRASDYEQEKTRGDVLYKGYIDSTHRIKELEQERDYLDTKCAAFENDFVLLDVTEKLKNAEAHIVELEEALAKIENRELAKHLNFSKSDQIQELRNENARLREQLRWHDAKKEPPNKSGHYIVMTTLGLLAIMYYNYTSTYGWNAPGIVSKWCYIPDDKESE